MDNLLAKTRRLLVVFHILVLVHSKSQANGDSTCLNPQLKWATFDSTVFISCPITPNDPHLDHLWWIGRDSCAPETFQRYGVSNNFCSDGSNRCVLPFDRFNRDSSTIICCSENAVTNFESAREKHCFQIAVCPTMPSMSVPQFVYTDNPETAYIQIITKPRPSTSPTIVITIDGVANQTLTTTTIAVPSLEGTEQALYFNYAFKFQVPRHMAVDSSTTLKFQADLSDIPVDSTCGTISVQSVLGVRVVHSEPDVVTTATIQTQTHPTEPSTGDLTDSGHCIQTTIGATLAALIVGLFLGLFVSLIAWVVMRNKDNKNGRGSTTQRQLPPIPNVRQTPPTNFPHTLLTPSSNGTLTATPTPTEVQGLLAGQTPNMSPPIDLHPLHPSSISPYLTTNEAQMVHAQSVGVNNPLTVSATGSGVPLGFSTTSGLTTLCGSSPIEHRMLNTSSKYVHRGEREFSPGQGSVVKSDLYSREGNDIRLDERYRENDTKDDCVV